MVRWSILIASHASRTIQLGRLASTLAPQLTSDVETVVLWNRGGLPVGDYRRMLIDDAEGEWVCFVDDDDRIPPHYVASILKALETSPDYVGFNVEVVDIAGQIGVKGHKYDAIHTLKVRKWSQSGTTFYRHVSHLNPIRRNLALKGVWEGDYAEDHKWADSVRPYVETEVYLDDTLYFYDFDHMKSIRAGHHTPADERPALPEGFRFHPDSEE